MAYPDGHDFAGKPLDLAFVITGPEAPDTDFGDAPDPPYPTLFVNNGARHVISPRVYLGARVDGEFDGQPNATARSFKAYCRAVDSRCSSTWCCVDCRT